jgi:hypothetical protein
MTRIVIELDGNLQENDIIVAKNGRWQVQSKTAFLKEVKQNLATQNDELEQLKTDINKMKVAIDQKFKEHHQIIQNLVKEQ